MNFSPNMVFLNRSFDKKRLKALLLWFRLNLSEGAALEAVEILQGLGFRSATQGAISLGLDDLKTPTSKNGRVFQAQLEVALAHHEHHRGNRTPVELFQHLVDTWHRTSQDLTAEVVQLFHSTERVNPVYMMAFSGARGNLSQVRQLVGMRGLMADPRGQIVGFPILSNFREGLTITEYFVSCYGARKGVVDTAIRTADAGYLTRRLADVSHHFVVRTTNCGTQRTICLKDIKEGQKTILPLASRLVGRVLGEHIPQIAFRNQEITPDLASKLASQCNSLEVRSPLSCSLRWGVCQLCYGWGLSEGRRVTLGEAVGIIAAQSIGEPGTQLTLRTFHTGGVFSGDLLNEIRAPYNGTVFFPSPLQGLLVRTPHGQIAFLTKVSGKMILSFSEKNLIGNVIECTSRCKEIDENPPGGIKDALASHKYPAVSCTENPSFIEGNPSAALEAEKKGTNKASKMHRFANGTLVGNASHQPLNSEKTIKSSDFEAASHALAPKVQSNADTMSAQELIRCTAQPGVMHQRRKAIGIEDTRQIEDRNISDALLGTQKENKEFFLQPSTVIFVRQKEQVITNQLLAEFSSSTLQPISDQIEVTQQVLSESAGQVWFKEIEYGNRKGPGSGSLGTHFSSQKLGGVWVLAGKSRSEIILNDRQHFPVNMFFPHAPHNASMVQGTPTVGVKVQAGVHVQVHAYRSPLVQKYTQSVQELEYAHNVYHDDHVFKYNYSLGYSQLHSLLRTNSITFLFAEKHGVAYQFHYLCRSSNQFLGIFDATKSTTIGPDKKANGKSASHQPLHQIFDLKQATEGVAWWLEKEWKAAPGMLLAEPFFSSKQHWRATPSGQIFWLGSSFIQQKRQTFTCKASEEIRRLPSDPSNLPLANCREYTVGVKPSFEKKDAINSLCVHLASTRPGCKEDVYGVALQIGTRLESKLKNYKSESGFISDAIFCIYDEEPKLDTNLRLAKPRTYGARRYTELVLHQRCNPVIKKLIQTLNLTRRQYSAINKGVFAPLKQNSTFGSFTALLNCAHSVTDTPFLQINALNSNVTSSMPCNVLVPQVHVQEDDIRAKQGNAPHNASGIKDAKPYGVKVQEDVTVGTCGARVVTYGELKTRLTLNLFWQPLSLATYPNKIVREYNSTSPTKFTNRRLHQRQSKGYRRYSTVLVENSVVRFGNNKVAMHRRYNYASSNSCFARSELYGKGQTHGVDFNSAGQKLGDSRYAVQTEGVFAPKPIWLSIHISKNSLSNFFESTISSSSHAPFACTVGAKGIEDTRQMQSYAMLIEKKLENIGKRKRVEKNDNSLDQHIVHTVNLPIVSFPYLIPNMHLACTCNAHAPAVQVQEDASPGCKLHVVNGYRRYSTIGFANRRLVGTTLESELIWGATPSANHIQLICSGVENINYKGCQSIRWTCNIFSVPRKKQVKSTNLGLPNRPLRLLRMCTHKEFKWKATPTVKPPLGAEKMHYPIYERSVEGATPVQGEILPLIRQTFWKDKLFDLPFSPDSAVSDTAQPISNTPYGVKVQEDVTVGFGNRRLVANEIGTTLVSKILEESKFKKACYASHQPLNELATFGDLICIKGVKEWIKNVARQKLFSCTHLVNSSGNAMHPGCKAQRCKGIEDTPQMQSDISHIQFAVSLPIKIISNLQGRYTSAHLTLRATPPQKGYCAVHRRCKGASKTDICTYAVSNSLRAEKMQTKQKLDRLDALCKKDIKKSNSMYLRYKQLLFRFNSNFKKDYFASHQPLIGVAMHLSSIFDTLALAPQVHVHCIANPTNLRLANPFSYDPASHQPLQKQRYTSSYTTGALQVGCIEDASNISKFEGAQEFTPSVSYQRISHTCCYRLMQRIVEYPSERGVLNRWVTTRRRKLQYSSFSMVEYLRYQCTSGALVSKILDKCIAGALQELGSQTTIKKKDDTNGLHQRCALPIRNKVWIAEKKFTSFNGAIFLDWYAFPLAADSMHESNSRRLPSNSLCAPTVQVRDPASNTQKQRRYKKQAYGSASKMHQGFIGNRRLEELETQSNIATTLPSFQPKVKTLLKNKQSFQRSVEVPFLSESDQITFITNDKILLSNYQKHTTGITIWQKRSTIDCQIGSQTTHCLPFEGTPITFFGYTCTCGVSLASSILYMRSKQSGLHLCTEGASCTCTCLSLLASLHLRCTYGASAPEVQRVSKILDRCTAGALSAPLYRRCIVHRASSIVHVPFSPGVTTTTLKLRNNHEVIGVDSNKRHYVPDGNRSRFTFLGLKRYMCTDCIENFCRVSSIPIAGTQQIPDAWRSSPVTPTASLIGELRQNVTSITPPPTLHYTPTVYPGQLVTYGEKIDQKSATTESGQVLYVDSQRATLRKAQTVLIYSQAILSVLSGEWIKKSAPLMALSYQKLVTGDIVQGLPKIEQFFEAPLLKDGTFWSDSLQAKLNLFFQEHRGKFPLAEAVRKGFSDIQRVLVEGVQRVYISQGVLIADKHLEVIVRQMTCKGRILYSGDTGFLRNELVALDKIESVNQVTYGQKALYHPQVRGITDASLESESFLSAASFQETTRVLSRDAVIGKTDLMRGLKERVIVGELIQAGTGLTNNSVYSFLLD